MKLEVSPAGNVALRPIPARARAILRFWFGAPGDPEHGRERRLWWHPDPSFDDAIHARFAADHDRVLTGSCESWRSAPAACLAYVLVLDQFSRNLYRGTSRAYDGDARALSAAKNALARGFDVWMSPLERQFLYLPFMHSENLEDQHRSVQGFEALAAADPPVGGIGTARRYLRVIERFGRFPQRNLALRRRSSPEEIAFLADAGHTEEPRR